MQLEGGVLYVSARTHRRPALAALHGGIEGVLGIHDREAPIRPRSLRGVDHGRQQRATARNVELVTAHVLA